ncbi:MAG: 3-dehydroquinate synthase [Paludibacteraceae bacterium]|nr:3-dehydroquinate synthase [Paludibacteraceae bacterium]
MSNFIVTNKIEKELATVIKSLAADRVFVLVDENTAEHCLPIVMPELQDAIIIKIKAGDETKSIDTAVDIWEILVDKGATRSSLLINLGGGVVTDLGGFVAATFKRGMHFVNIPTTLLGVVDAATGGKTGVNFKGLKNEIGAFATAEKVLIDTRFFKTLDFKNRLSGYAEMVKHALIADSILLEQTLNYDLDSFDMTRLATLLKQNLQIKENIVEVDLHESGLRKALNFGHTVGHAFESLSYEMGNPMLHGFAVMWGIIAELYLSLIKLKFDKKIVSQILAFTKEYYGAFPYTCKQYDRLYELMLHDKKNSNGQINFTLLASVGDVRINQKVTKEEVFEALDYLREN